MTTFVLTYDLNKDETSEDYKELIDELKRLKAHKYQYSAWLINLSNTAKEVHDHFKSFMDKDDSLWVSELTKKNHYSGAKSGTNQWLKDNPPER
ncbi:CRISPR-associated protein Cas2 [Mesorhizobium sp. WSM3864]|uniref:CRISPR-associated protein Cas2 n=1 Tax=Mesorhizobium sp. WSM3864 TaxID=2029404 RepID=UPI000BB06C0F|nr:CRISPR-associated protein Cas2 [Mesorhizobium sp. WSM3864]PBB93233.1 CRISPR-associated protein Cas2 [Mesorhizobium sp. WSM3864]